jgi:signal transduction histidine kinase
MNDEDAHPPPEQRSVDDTSKLAHDLRNPLGSALMALTLLRARLTSTDDLRLLDTLERNLKRLDRIIDERIAKLPRPEL